MAKKELIQIRRDPVLWRMVIGFPVVLLLLFGYAINFTVSKVPMTVYNASPGRISQALILQLTKDKRFVVRHRVATAAGVRETLLQDKARVGLVIPAGVQGDVRADKSVPVEIYLDGSDPNFAFQVQAELRKALGEVNTRILAGRALAGLAATPPLTPSLHTLFNPDNKTTWFMIPGVIVILLTILAVLLTSLSIVRERDSKTMETLISTPIRPIELVMGKVLPYLLLAFTDALLVLGLGAWVFGVPIRGSLTLLLVLSLFYLLGSLGVGILISTLARNQLQAVFGTFAYYLPAIFLSGLFFPISGVPPWVQWITYLVPAQYFLEILRGILLKGTGLDALWVPALLTTLFGIGVLFLAASRLRKQLVT